jgi:hypothetical protein
MKKSFEWKETFWVSRLRQAISRQETRLPVQPVGNCSSPPIGLEAQQDKRTASDKSRMPHALPDAKQASDIPSLASHHG